MECDRCVVCGRAVGAEVLCHYVTDGGVAYASCSCLCADCRRYLQERADLTLWRPGQASGAREG